MSVGAHDHYVTYCVDNVFDDGVYNVSICSWPPLLSDRTYGVPYGMPGGDEFVFVFLSRRVSR